MRKPYYLFICIAIAFGCGDKDKFLFSQAETDLVVNPETKVLVKENTLVYSRLDSGNIIHGISKNLVFNTSDQFKTFDYKSSTLPTNITPFVIDKNIAITASGDVMTPAIQISVDYGTSWTSFTPTLTPALSPTGYYSTELISVNYIDDQTVMMIFSQKSVSSADKRTLYRVNIGAQTGTVVSSFSDAWLPAAMKFADNQTGWMLMYNSGAYGTTYISKTVDSGKNWTAPKIIDKNIMSNLQVDANGVLSASYTSGNAAFSSDSGATWKKPAGGIRFTCVHRVNANVAYGISDSDLKKTTDGGLTWEDVPNSGYEFVNMKNIYFQNEDNGIMYADQKLYITADGGKTWKTLLYPYSYIIE